MTDEFAPPQHQDDPTFKRNGPEPPENDSGPSPSIEEVNRTDETTGRPIDPAAIDPAAPPRPVRS